MRRNRIQTNLSKFYYPINSVNKHNFCYEQKADKRSRVLSTSINLHVTQRDYSNEKTYFDVRDMNVEESIQHVRSFKNSI